MKNNRKFFFVALVVLTLIFNIKLLFASVITIQPPAKNPLMRVEGKISPLQVKNIPSIADVKEILKNFSIAQKSNRPSYDCGLKFFNEYFAFLEAGLSLAELAKDLPIVAKFNEGSTNLCLLYSLHQISLDLLEEKRTEAVLNLTKEMTTYSFGKWGTSAMKIANVGVFLIDYSLTKFGSRVHEVVNNAYKRSYANYNLTKNPLRKTDNQWIDFFVKTIYESKDIRKTIDNEIEPYLKPFFNEEGIRIQEDKRKELMDEERIRIYKIFHSNTDKILADIKRMRDKDIQKIYDSTRDLLNQEFSISVNLIADKYERYPIKIIVSEDQSLWEGYTKESGTWNFRCTYAGYIAYNKPRRIELVYKGKTLSQPFIVTERGAFVTFDLRNIKDEVVKEKMETEDNNINGIYEGNIYYKFSNQTTVSGPCQIIIRGAKDIVLKASYKGDEKHYDTQGDGVSKATGALDYTRMIEGKIEAKGEYTKNNANDHFIIVKGKEDREYRVVYVNSSVNPSTQKNTVNWAIYLGVYGNKIAVNKKWLGNQADSYPYQVNVVKKRN